MSSEYNPAVPAAGQRKLIDCLIIAGVACIAAVLLRPFQNTPFVDDFVYAWPVEHLLETGELRIMDFSGAINVPQILWGAVFALPYGFSFTAMRISTFTLAVAALCTLYLLLRELGIGRTGALLIAAVMGVYPTFFILSVTFMTDVPFVALIIGATYAMARALRTRSIPWLVLANVFLSLSMGLRLIGLPFAAAQGLVLLAACGKWGRRWPLLVALMPLVATALLMAWRNGHTVTPADVSWVENSPEYRAKNLPYALPLLPRMSLTTICYLSAETGIALLPLALAVATPKLLRRGGVIFILLIGLVLLTLGLGEHILRPLLPANTWALDELGATLPLIPGAEMFKAASWVYWSIAVIGWASTSLLLATLIRRPTPLELYLVLSILFTIGMMACLWLFYDRYALPVVVPLAILVLARPQPLRIVRALPMLIIFGVFCLVGTRDHLNYNGAVWSAVDRLRAQGASDGQIDGGYVVNGWLQYAHPEHAARDASGEVMIPWINSDQVLRYQISNRPNPKAKTLETVPYRRWLGSDGELYLLEYEGK